MLRIARRHRIDLIVLAVMIGFVGARLYIFLHTPPAAVRLLTWDIAGYSTALIQGSDPQLLTRDTVFGNGLFTNSIWYGSSFLYMSALRVFYELTQGDIWLTFGYLNILVLALFLVVVYLFYEFDLG